MEQTSVDFMDDLERSHRCQVTKKRRILMFITHYYTLADLYKGSSAYASGRRRRCEFSRLNSGAGVCAKLREVQVQVSRAGPEAERK